MRTMQRAIAMVGLTLMTGGVMATAATAATAAPTTGQTESVQVTERHRGHDDDFGRRSFRPGGDRYVVDWFRTRKSCLRAGWWGDQIGKFDDPRCIRIGRYYVLTAEREHNGRRGGRH